MEGLDFNENKDIKENKGYDLYKLIIRILVPCILVVLLVVFTFFDLNISISLYNQKDVFSKIFAIIGEGPMHIVLVFSFSLLFKFRSKKSKAIDILLGILFALLICFASCYGGYIVCSQSGISIWYSPLVGLIFALLGVSLSFIVKKDKQKEGVKFALASIAFFISMLVVMQVLKISWSRLRFREFDSNLSYEEQFMPWYLPAFKFSMSSKYASFPSGHVMQATGVLFITLFPKLININKKYEFILDIVCVIWVVIVAFTRVVLGAHFTTDVTMGALLSYTIFEVIRLGFYKRKYTKKNGCEKLN